MVGERCILGLGARRAACFGSPVSTHRGSPRPEGLLAPAGGECGLGVGRCPLGGFPRSGGPLRVPLRSGSGGPTRSSRARPEAAASRREKMGKRSNRK